MRSNGFPSYAPVLRAYRAADAAGTLEVFTAAIVETAAADYTRMQIEAWARPNTRELAEWNAAMLWRRTFVAEIAGEIIGFSDVNVDGYVDMMFVSPQHQRRGIASKLLDHVEAVARRDGATELSANVSVTARPF